MAIYDLYIFDRHCVCVFYASWNRQAQAQAQAQALGTAGSQPTDKLDNGGSSGQAAGAAGAAGTGMGAGANAASGGLGAGGMAGVAVDKQAEENAKLVYGVVFSLRNIVSKISPKQGDNFLSYRTSNYKLHYFDTATGLKLVLLTDPGMENMTEVLRAIYSQIYVEYVSKNPLVALDSGQIQNELFRTNLMRFVRTLPGFNA